MVEAVGIEPASRCPLVKASTCRPPDNLKMLPAVCQIGGHLDYKSFKNSSTVSSACLRILFNTGRGRSNLSCLGMVTLSLVLLECLS